LFKHLDAYAAQLRQDPEQGTRSYLERYFYEPKSWTEYLELLGLDELLDAGRRGKSIYDD
jgi:glutaconate CoA-transferase subunit A